jgi:hypothetical protein
VSKWKFEKAFACIYIHILPYNYSPIVMAHPSKCVSYVVCKIWFNPPFLWKCLYQVRAIAVFPVFRLLNDFFCLLTYEFCLSLWKIARCSVILLLHLCRLSISQDMCSMITTQAANLVSNQPLIDLKMFHIVTCKTKYSIAS